MRTDVGGLAGVAAVGHLSKACHRVKTQVDCVYEVGGGGKAGLRARSLASGAFPYAAPAALLIVLAVAHRRRRSARSKSAARNTL